MLAMTLYPDVVRRAQAYIDPVVGHERMPTFGDRSKLPYIDAIVKEVLRWRPVASIGVPRRSTQVSILKIALSIGFTVLNPPFTGRLV